jgi:tetratricopeptide (TPR) repeat protein
MDINLYVQHYIIHRLGGFELDEDNAKFKYLLKNSFEDLDGSHRVFFTEGFDNLSQFPFDYHFDKSKQTAPEPDESDNRKDVFDELIPIMIADEECRVKILFPYNKADNHWMVGELDLLRKGNAISVLVLAHDPYGKGKLSNMKFQMLENRLKQALFQFDVKVSLEISPYTTNRLSLADAISSGVVVADELVKRITNESLTISTAYPVGARQLRECHIRFLVAVSCDEGQSFIENIALEELEFEDSKELELVLPIKDVTTKLNEIINSGGLVKDRIELLQKIERDYYKPLVLQLAHPHSIEELKDLIHVLNDLTILALAMSDLTDKVEYTTEAAVFCQYLKTIFNEKFPVAQRDKFQELNSIHPSQLWKRIQEKFVTKIGGNMELILNMTDDAEEYDKLVTNMRIQAKQEFVSIDNHLEHLRKTYPQDMDENRHSTVEPIRNLFRQVAEQMKSLLEKLYKDSEKLMATPPPCRYAIIGLGSLALQQITPYSDFEFAILTELDAHTNPQIMNYFTNLTHLANLKTIGLGETIVPTSKFEVDLAHLVHVGINFDLGGKTPIGRADKPYSLIKTVPEMLKYVYNKDDKITHIDKCLPYILENVCFVSGDKHLFEEYQEKVSIFLKERNHDNQKNCEARALKILTEGAVEFDYINKQPNLEPKKKKFDGDLEKLEPNLIQSDGKYFNVKQEIYRLSDRMIYNLGLYFGIEGTSCWDTIDKLKEAATINDSAHKNLLYAVSFANLLRLKTYFKNEAQTGEMSIYPTNSSRLTMLELTEEDLEEHGELFNYFYRAFPLHKKLESFCSKHEELTFSAKRGFFQNESFLKSDSAIKGLIYFRLNQYENALRHFKVALETAERDDRSKILEVMGDSYLKIDDFEESLKMFETLKNDQEFSNWQTLRKLQISKKIGLLLYLNDNNLLALTCLEDTLKEEEFFYKNKPDPEIAYTLDYIGEIFKSNHDLKMAKMYFQKSLNMRKQFSKGTPNLDVASSMINIADLYSAEGELDLAIKFYEEGLKIQKSIFKDAPNLKVAHALNSIGNVYSKRDEFSLALKYFEKYLQMLKVVSKNISTTKVVNFLSHIGEIYQSKGEFGLALMYHKEGLKMKMENCKDAPHLDIATSLDKIGLAHQSQGNYQLALNNYSKSLEMKKIILNGKNSHSNIAYSLDRIAKIHFDMGNHDLSKQYYKEYLKNLRTDFRQDSNSKNSISPSSAGNAYYYTGKYNLAIVNYKKCFEREMAVFKDAAHSEMGQTLYNIGYSYYSQDKYDLALEYGKKSLDMRIAVFKDILNPDVSKSLNNMSLTFQFQREFESALDNFKDSLQMDKDVAHPDIATSLNLIGNVHYYKGQYDLSLEHYEKSLQLLKSSLKNDAHPKVATSLYNIGLIHYSQGKYDLALEYYEESLDMRKKIYKDTAHPNVATSLYNTGLAYQSQKKYDLALGYHKESLDMRQIVHKDTAHLDVGSSLNHIGNVYYFKNDFNLALKYYKQGLEMFQAVFGDSANPKVATSLFNIGLIHYSQGKYDLALEYHKESLDMRRIFHKDTAHPDVATSLYNIGLAYQFQKKYDLALEYHKESLEMRRIVYKDTAHLTVGSSLNHIGNVYYYKNDFNLALKYYKQGLEIFQAVFGDIANPKVATSLYNIGLAYGSQSDYNLAVKYYKEALDMRRIVHKDTAHQDVSSSLCQIGLAYQSLENYDLALEYHKECLEMRKKLHKDIVHQDIGFSLNYIGDLYYDKSYFKLALKYYEEGLEMFKAVFGDIAHPEIANSLSNIGLAYHSQEKYDTALEYHHESLKMRKIVHKDTAHPDIISSLNNIGDAYGELSIQYYDASTALESELH